MRQLLLHVRWAAVVARLQLRWDDTATAYLTTDPPGSLIPEDMADILRDKHGPTGGGVSWAGRGVLSMTRAKAARAAEYLRAEGHKVEAIEGSATRTSPTRTVCAVCEVPVPWARIVDLAGAPCRGERYAHSEPHLCDPDPDPEPHAHGPMCPNCEVTP